MTTELTKAAQQALEALEAVMRHVRREAPHLTGKLWGFADSSADALRRALTQRPAAQTERDILNDSAWIAGAKFGWNCGVEGTRDLLNQCIEQRVKDRVEARASLPAYQQATPALTAEQIEAAIGYRLPPHNMRLLQELIARHAGQQATPEPVGERWVVVRETTLDVGDGNDVRTGGRPELGYALISDAATFGSEDEAVAAIKSASLPVGWVVLPLSRLLPDLMANRPAPVETEPVGEPFGWVCRYLCHADEDGEQRWTDWYFTLSSESAPPKWSRGSYAEQEAVPVFTRPAPGVPDWTECLRISEAPNVDEALRLFAEGETSEDQSVCIVRAVIEAYLRSKHGNV